MHVVSTGTSNVDTKTVFCGNQQFRHQHKHAGFLQDMDTQTPKRYFNVDCEKEDWLKEDFLTASLASTQYSLKQTEIYTICFIFICFNLGIHMVFCQNQQFGHTCSLATQTLFCKSQQSGHEILVNNDLNTSAEFYKDKLAEYLFSDLCIRNSSPDKKR